MYWGSEGISKTSKFKAKNVKNLGLGTRIKILKQDFDSFFFQEQFDIIISNPPYIAIGDSRVNAGAKYDPDIALYAGEDGLSAYRAIARNARATLKPEGKIFLEIGAGMGNEVRKIFKDENWKDGKSYKDLGGIERVLEFNL